MGLGKHLRAGPPATLRRGCGRQRAGHAAVFKETSHAHWIRLRGAALLTEDGRGLPPRTHASPTRQDRNHTEDARRRGVPGLAPGPGPCPHSLLTASASSGHAGASQRPARAWLVAGGRGVPAQTRAAHCRMKPGW